MPGMTEEDKEIIDLKLSKMESAIKQELFDLQQPYNIKIGEIHQEIMGYGERPGISKRLEKQECRIYDIEDRLRVIEDNRNGKIETRKAIFGMIGSGGLVGALAWLSQFIGGGKAP